VFLINLKNHISPLSELCKNTKFYCCLW